MLRIAGGAAALLLAIVAYSAAKSGTSLLTGDYGNGSVSERAQSALSDDTIKEYVATDYGFKANFPGFPAIDRQSIPVQGYDVPYVTYARQINGGTQDYLAIVWDYRNVPISESDLSLEGAFNGMVQNTDGAKIVSSNDAVLGGAKALEGHYTAPLDGTTYDAYVRLTTRGKQMVGAMTIGANYTDFQTFANSLQFIN